MALSILEIGGTGPDEVLAKFLGDEAQQEEFWQRAKTNLQAGKIRLVFVADKIPAELQRIVEFLNKQMDPAEVLAVEVRQFVGEGLRTLVPKVIGQTMEAQQKKSPITKSEPDEQVTRFWMSYWRIASGQFPELNMPEPGPKPPGAWFIYFYPPLPSGVSLIHKLETGNVDLQFLGKGTMLENFKESFKPYLNENMTITPTGKSAVVRIEVPKIHRFEDIDQQKDHVIIGLKSAKALLDWFNETNKEINLKQVNDQET